MNNPLISVGFKIVSFESPNKNIKTLPVAKPIPCEIKVDKKLVTKKYKGGGFEFTDEQDRGKLSEGRNYGMGFALCKRVGKNIATTMPISPCKDYLNDKVFSEHTGKPWDAHGLHTERQNIFEFGEAYMAFSICGRGARNPSSYGNYEKEINTLEKNWQNLEKFINQVEEKFKFKQKTKIVRLGKNKYLTIFSLDWVAGTYLISLYSLLLRAGFFYIEGDVVKYMENYKECNDDVYLMKTALPKIKKMLDGNIPKQDLNNIHSPHNEGIISFNGL